jgi:hypothetical protein
MLPAGVATTSCNTGISSRLKAGGFLADPDSGVGAGCFLFSPVEAGAAAFSSGFFSGSAIASF